MAHFQSVRRPTKRPTCRDADLRAYLPADSCANTPLYTLTHLPTRLLNRRLYHNCVKYARTTSLCAQIW